VNDNFLLPQDFVRSLLACDRNASVVLAGDMNEFVHTRSVFAALSGMLYDINEVSDIDPVERYTYVYEQHTQEIDQMFVSSAVARRQTEVEHVHVNTWASSIGERASDHDPTVAKVRVCEGSRGTSIVFYMIGSSVDNLAFCRCRWHRAGTFNTEILTRIVFVPVCNA
jgi:predicted extracellular nuclease